jgi:GEVED domain/FlgD Ig-like domain
MNTKRFTVPTIRLRTIPLILILALAFGGVARAQNLLVNPDAETGTVVGWTLDLLGAGTGNAGIIGTVTEQVQTGPTVYPYQGEWFFSFAVQQTATSTGSGERISMYQTGLVATGTDQLFLTGWVQTEYGDPGEAALSFYSLSGGFLGSASTGSMIQDTGWGSFSLAAAVPVGAATWRVELFGTVNVGVFTNVFWDDLSLEDSTVRLDFGDAPDGVGVVLYPTLLLNNGARHEIGGPWLGDAGDAPDPEPDGQPDMAALGDDNDGNDDENGVTIPDLVQGQDAVITLEVSGVAGYVDGWIDFNGDKAWSPTNEKILSGLLSPGSHQFTVAVPENAETGSTMARFRINSVGSLASVGSAADGEVEDYEVTISPKWALAPDVSPDGVDFDMSFYAIADDFECTLPGPITGIRFWGSWKHGSDYISDFFQLRIFSNLPAEQSPTGYSMPDSLLWTSPVVPDDGESGVYLQNLTGSWTGYNSIVQPHDWACWEYITHIPRDEAFVQTGTPEQPQVYWLNLQYILGSYYEFGWKTTPVGWNAAGVVYVDGLGWEEIVYPDGHPRVGEPLDFSFEIITQPGERWDFGDAPFDLTLGGYPTPLAHGGAYHVIGGPWLGDASDQPDPEFDGQPHAQALGDNVAGLDDEGGVIFSPLHEGMIEQVTVEVNGGGGFLQAWFDFDQDRIWETAEMVIADSYPDGVHEIDIQVPYYAEIGETFARFRISSSGDLQPGGVAPDGEVEDYRIVIEEGPSDVSDPNLPRAFRLYSCVPNPFNPSTTIRFDLPRDEQVDLVVYDVAGRRVRTLLAGVPMKAGQREVVWSGRDDTGREVSAGVYFCRLRAGKFCGTQRAALVK